MEPILPGRHRGAWHQTEETGRAVRPAAEGKPYSTPSNWWSALVSGALSVWPPPGSAGSLASAASSPAASAGSGAPAGLPHLSAFYARGAGGLRLAALAR